MLVVLLFLYIKIMIRYIICIIAFKFNIQIGAIAFPTDITLFRGHCKKLASDTVKTLHFFCKLQKSKPCFLPEVSCATINSWRIP